MEVYVKEHLHVLDYNNNIVDTIFNSDDHRTAGYAYDIDITEANTGYSDLKFNMPNIIHTDKGETIKNPKLALLTPLVKLRYKRQVYYVGDRPITVKEPQGYGDTTVYVDRTYSNKYPENIIEDYVMDYIVQPVDKKRDVLKLNTTFTAIDYPRFNLSKKRVGLTIDQNTLTRDEWSLFKNEPMDQPGTIKYLKWNESLSKTCGNANIPLVWDPENARQYPLDKVAITNLIASTADWPYGLLATAFYWPIVSTGRFEGRLYKKGGYLVLHLYDFYNLSTEGVNPDLWVDRYAWDWTQLYEVDSYLCPNNAKNYLHHILEGTNWTVAKRKDGTDDVDIVQSWIPNPAGSTTDSTLADDTCNISVSGSNCYNAIVSVCQGLQLYPIFDCEKRTVALRMFAGKNYGLTYSLGKNLKSNEAKLDGEKVITKLYCSGGKDYNGDANINIGTAERAYLKTFNGFYKNRADLPTNDVEGYWAIVDSGFKDEDFKVTKYKEDMSPYTVTVHDTLVKNYWNASSNRQVYVYNNKTNTWSLGTKLDNGNWSVMVGGLEVIVDPITGTQAPWDPNDEMYIFSRSPYGTNYILNFKWMYQNNWMTKEQILELYQYEQQIHDLDYMFMEPYTEDRLKTQQAYNEAINNYDVAQDEYESTLYAMENKYYNVDGKYSEGYTYCFHVAPQGTYQAYNSELRKTTSFIKLFHCYDCHDTYAIEPNGKSAGANITTCPNCKSKDVTNDEIYIPTFDVYKDDFEFKDTDYPEGTDVTNKYPGYQYNPHLKGYWQRLVMSMDRIDTADAWDIHAYESLIKMIVTGMNDQAIPFRDRNATFEDGYNYKISGVYVKSASGQIEVWNDAVRKYTSSYGNMLDYLREVNACLERIKELQILYDKWEAERDRLHAIIQEKFGDYIVEGSYVNDEQPYIGLLFKEGMEASDKFSTPEVTYNLDVIDSTGLIEYRMPKATKYICAHCGYTAYNPITECPKCDSVTVNVELDTYNDLVHILHSVGQIVPKAGDYVTIYDEPMGMFGVPGLITEITRYLDNPINNKIKLDTGYTDDEELVGNIITATNTVLSNADIYARTSVLKSDGTLDPTSVRNSLDNSNADITIVGTNGSILLNGSGLRCTDPSNPNRAMKYAGNGVFNTTNLGVEGEATIWEKMMTPEGINATYIRSGTIDTNKLTILSGLYAKVVLDQYGLYVKSTASRSAHVTEFDYNEAKKDTNYGLEWGKNNNIASFIGVDTKNNPLIYTKGFLYAEAGSNIANWITDEDGFYHLDSSGKKDFWLSTTGITGEVTQDHLTSGLQNFLIYAKGKFGVTDKGTLYAAGANLTGYIYVTDSNSNMNTGEVGGWKSTENGLQNGDTNTIWLAASGRNGTVNGYTRNFALYSRGNFGVDVDGHMYAKNGNFTGQITITSAEGGDGSNISTGKVGGFDTTSGGFASNDIIVLSPTGYSNTVTVNDNKSSNGPWAIYSKGNMGVTTGGVLWARGAVIGGTIYADAGNIGGAIIENGKITIKDAHIDTLSINKITSGTNNATMTFNGSITCNNLTAKNKGNIGGWEISPEKIYSEKTSGGVKATSELNPNGSFHFYSGYKSSINSWAECIFDDDEFTVTAEKIKVYALNSLNLELDAFGKGDLKISSGTGKLILQPGDGLYLGGTKAITGHVKFTGGILGKACYLGFLDGIIVYAGYDFAECAVTVGTNKEWFECL